MIDKKLAELDESFREIESLADLYEGLVGEAAPREELGVRREEARFVRDRLLRLSLHAKHLTEKIETRLK
ncbi:hypothetical protein ACFL0V_04180 [Nanoarchaeota archaeon]